MPIIIFAIHLKSMTNKPASLDLINILVVDDLPDNLHLLANALKPEGYNVRGVVNGSMALIAARSALPQLILLDINMPEMDGYEVCQKLKADSLTAEIPVIFLSAYDDVFDKVKAFRVGGVDYITKPFQIDEVIVRIENQLKLQAAKQEIRQLNDELEQRVKQRTNELRATNQKLQQEVIQRKKAQLEAEKADRAKSEFLANMSHELRTPLNAILGFTQLMLRSNSLASEHIEKLNIINQSGSHLLTLINEILEMSKIEAGCLTLENKSCDLYQMLTGLKKMLSLKAEAKGLEFKFEQLGEIPQYIETDEIKLRQVLINLLSNAIKFTDRGQIILRVGSKQQQEQNIQLWFEVEDTGSGIAPDELNNLFAPFVQTTTGIKSHEGTGLGLAISQQYINLMKGKINVSSILGQGTKFDFTIQTRLAEAIIAKPLLPNRVVGLAPHQTKYRILVVEDQNANRQLLVKLLTIVGFAVKEAVNGQQGVEIWQEWSPHLIFMDMQMPVMDGLSATKLIKSTPQGQETIIIAFTANAFKEQEQQIRVFGCDDFISKPLIEHLLWEKIAQHLQVEYVYQELSEELPQSQPETLDLTPEEFKVMSSEWITQLHYLASAADAKQLDRLIEQIPPKHSNLAQNLQKLIDNFGFEEIVDLVDNYSSLNNS